MNRPEPDCLAVEDFGNNLSKHLRLDFRGFLAAIVPVQVRARDRFALASQASVDNFAYDQCVIARFINGPDLAFQISEGLAQNWRAGIFFDMADLAELIADGPERAFQSSNDPPRFFIKQIQGEYLPSFHQVIGAGRFAHGHQQQWRLKRALCDPACSQCIHCSIAPATDAQDVKPVGDLG